MPHTPITTAAAVAAATRAQVYTIYPILAVVFCILLVVTAFITVALTCEQRQQGSRKGYVGISTSGGTG